MPSGTDPQKLGMLRIAQLVSKPEAACTCYQNSRAHGLVGELRTCPITAPTSHPQVIPTRPLKGPLSLAQCQGV